MHAGTKQRILTGAAALALSAGWSAGQAPQPAPTPIRPPTVTNNDKPPIVGMYFTMVVILVLVVGANLIPSKRGHQD
jgi:hypothetical protein